MDMHNQARPISRLVKHVLYVMQFSGHDVTVSTQRL